jgi:sulfoxide reductase heme-binding subunit YedZ
MQKIRFTPLQILVHLGAWLPLMRLVFDFFSGGLTVNPIQEMEQRTGRAAITLLLLSLACTPLNTFFGWREAIKRRRALGLYAFFYATLHMLIFVDLDYGLAWSLLVQTIFEKPFILVGATAFLLLLPLAITSFDVWKMRLGKSWKRLHRLVYLIAPLAVLHYAWSKKGNLFALQGDILKPLLYGFIVGILLLARLPGVRRRLASGWTRIGLPRPAPGPAPEAKAE